jgi:hypothetical protein
MDEVDRLMMNAFSVTQKKIDNGKINYGTVSKPPQKYTVLYKIEKNLTRL